VYGCQATSAFRTLSGPACESDIPQHRSEALPHLSELHGAATHLAVVAIPAYGLVLLLLRRVAARHAVLAGVEPWLLGAALVGVLVSGATGLLVWGQAQTTLRGQAFRVGNAHFWLGIALAVVVGACAAWRLLRRRDPQTAHGAPLLLGGVAALGLVVAQGYLGGRITYEHGVGVFRGGQMTQTAVGAKQLETALVTGHSETAAGMAAFADAGLGCARCHGDQAQGQRAPRLAGGADLPQFRRKHADGLFPRTVVTDRDFRAIDAWLHTLPHAG
jgi:uncharacterized membrane protein